MIVRPKISTNTMRKMGRSGARGRAGPRDDSELGDTSATLPRGSASPARTRVFDHRRRDLLLTNCSR